MSWNRFGFFDDLYELFCWLPIFHDEVILHVPEIICLEKNLHQIQIKRTKKPLVPEVLLELAIIYTGNIK